jgi:hypothetical protein
MALQGKRNCAHHAGQLRFLKSSQEHTMRLRQRKQMPMMEALPSFKGAENLMGDGCNKKENGFL